MYIALYGTEPTDNEVKVLNTYISRGVLSCEFIGLCAERLGLGEQLGRALSDYYKCLETNIFQTNALPKEFAPFKAELKKESVRMEGLKF